jgi:hypothetical protein
MAVERGTAAREGEVVFLQGGKRDEYVLGYRS